MQQSGVSAVAIVNKEGVLLSTLSVSDLKGLGQENFGSLLLPVLEYLQKHVYKGKKIPPPIMVVPR
jgi:hypothetical protein